MPLESAYIVIQGPGHDGTRLTLREGITSFGRLPSNDVILLGDLVSRHHSRIIFFDGKASLQDLGSHNGSWVNGEKVSTRPLKDGDAIRIGNFRVAFHEGVPGDARHAEPSNRPRPESTAQRSAPPERSRPKVDVAADIGTAMPTLGPRAMRAVVDSVPALPDGVVARDPRTNELVREVDRAASGRGADRTSAPTLLLLYKITEALSRATDVHEFLEEVLTFTLDRIPAEAALVFRLIPGVAEPVLLASRGPATEAEGQTFSSNVVRWATAKNFTVYSKDVGEDLRFNTGKSVMMLGEGTRALVCAPMGAADKVLGALYLTRSAEQPFSTPEVDAIEAICRLAATGIDRIELRQRAVEEGIAREVLSRFHSVDVVDRVLRDADDGATARRFLEGRTATVCFSDIQGFTALAERLTVEEVSGFLNAYLEQMSKIIFAHRGTINKLVGDAIVAVFGAPYSYGNDAARAVAAALEMRSAFDRLVAQNPAIGPRRLRFGIETGWILAGTIGSARRMEYVVIGETVNVAARIQSSAAPGAILLGEATYPLVSDAFNIRKLGLQQVRGRHEPLQIYEVTGRALVPPDDETTGG